MRAPIRTFGLFLAAALLISAVPAFATSFFGGKTTTQEKAHERPDSFADLVEGLLPAVVNISSTQKMEEESEMPAMPQLPPGSPFEDFFEQFMQRRGDSSPFPSVPASSLGSGFVIDAEKGYIITNNHVVKDAEDIRVSFQGDETLKAEVIGVDEKIDIAVLKVTPGKKKLTAVKFGDSDKLRVGDWVIAIGNPFGLGGTVTAGIVSARQRDINAGPYDDFIQTDASINRGNSGGPMFNANGEVIGINTAIFSPSGGSVGIGFALPSALAKPVIDQIIQFGHTRRGWLGVRIQSVTPEIAESLNLPQTEGALVASITAKSPAIGSGLEPGDVITEFNGQKLTAMRQLPRLVAETPIGADAVLKYWRDGKEHSTTIKVGELEKAEEDGLLAQGPRSETTKGVDIPTVGLTVEALTEMTRADYGIPATLEGVIVSSVDNMSEAAIKGLLEGDVIVEINQLPVSSPQNAADTVEAAQNEGKKSVLMLVNREGDIRFVALKLDEAPKKPAAIKEESKEKAKEEPKEE